MLALPRHARHHRPVRRDPARSPRCQATCAGGNRGDERHCDNTAACHTHECELLVCAQASAAPARPGNTLPRLTDVRCQMAARIRCTDAGPQRRPGLLQSTTDSAARRQDRRAWRASQGSTLRQTATNVSTAVTTTRVAGSVGETLNNTVEAARAAPSAAIRPDGQSGADREQHAAHHRPDDSRARARRARFGSPLLSCVRELQTPRLRRVPGQPAPTPSR